MYLRYNRQYDQDEPLQRTQENYVDGIALLSEIIITII